MTSDPYRLGQETGFGFAEVMRANRVVLTANPLADIVAIVASGEIPEAVRALVLNAGAQEAIDASEAADAEADFWAGFEAGARSYLDQQIHLGMSDN